MMKFPNDGFTIHIKKSWAFGCIGFILGIVATIVVSLSTGSAHAESKETSKEIEIANIRAGNADPTPGKYAVFCGGYADNMRLMPAGKIASHIEYWYNVDLPKGLKYIGQITGTPYICALFER
ncbi:MAG: hypothetical protein HY099_06505 [Nitrospirae bacterium]|nr:hypothetical protein [Nitrospirota bacterium]